MDAINIDHLTKLYGKSRGIKDVSLKVTSGEFFGFIGPNGAGKSTTIRLLLGLLAPSSGSSSIYGVDSFKERTKCLENVGYLPSESNFYPGMKVKDVIKLSANLHKKDCGSEAEILCERLRLDTQKKTEELSFGNKKKVGIVCALQHKPKLLILDEPTSGLDPLMQKEFFNILKEYKESGTTIFLSSHILFEVQNYCDRAAFIKEGNIVACDKVENLMKTSVKKVSVSGTGLHFEEMNGIKNMVCDGNEYTFLYSGDVNRLAQSLAAGNLTDFSVSEPNLEEVFLHYYKEEQV